MSDDDDPLMSTGAAAVRRDFTRRWSPIYGASPLFKHTATAYCMAWDNHGMDADRIRMLAIDQDLYDQAVAAGHDITQACPRCNARVACVKTLSSDDACDACEAKAEQERLAALARQAESKARYEAWWATLTQEERDAELAYQKSILEGLFMRDVQ